MRSLRANFNQWLTHVAGLPSPRLKASKRGHQSRHRGISGLRWPEDEERNRPAPSPGRHARQRQYVSRAHAAPDCVDDMDVGVALEQPVLSMPLVAKLGARESLKSGRASFPALKVWGV